MYVKNWLDFVAVEEEESVVGAEFVSQAYWGAWNKFTVFLGETIFSRWASIKLYLYI
jgi:hypothetical protein